MSNSAIMEKKYYSIRISVSEITSVSSANAESLVKELVIQNNNTPFIDGTALKIDLQFMLMNPRTSITIYYGPNENVYNTLLLDILSKFKFLNVFSVVLD